MTKAEFEVLAEGFVKGMKPIFESYQTRIAALEQRVQELEARPELKHCGVFKDTSAYEPGSLVTRSGGLWLATAKTAGAPGADPSWR